MTLVLSGGGRTETGLSGVEQADSDMAATAARLGMVSFFIFGFVLYILCATCWQYAMG